MAFDVNPIEDSRDEHDECRFEIERLTAENRRFREVLEMLGSGACASMSPPDDCPDPDAWQPCVGHQQLADWVMSASMLCLEDGMTREQIYEHRRRELESEQRKSQLQTSAQ